VKLIEGYVNNRLQLPSSDEKQALMDFMYQIVMQQGTTEYAIMTLFTPGLQAHQPLGSDKFLGNPELAFPVSFYYG